MKLSDVFGMLNTLMLLGIISYMAMATKPANVDERLQQAERMVSGSIAAMERALRSTNELVLKNSSDVHSHAKVLVDMSNDLKAIREQLSREPVK